MGDTDIEVTEYTSPDGIPKTAWALAAKVNPDEPTTTTLEIRSGMSSPHTTVCMAARIDDPNVYEVLFWTGGRDRFFTFALPLGDSSGYDTLRRVLQVIERVMCPKHKKEDGE